ncbi:MAG: histidine phosphatase family protein [Lachnospiraceae bacterium]|nr:histidine phosphatase family protein [Lachnospiraceae bacterium]
MHKVYFVRHGESEWNIENKICGQTDSPLTQKGHEQAIETGKIILEKQIKADMIIASPLSRAYETAKHISEITGIPMKVDERIIEQNFGVWEGTTPRNAPAFHEAKKQFIDSHGTGETMLKLAQRIYNLLDEIKADKDKTYILVAHNGIARVVKSYFEDMTNDEYAGFGVQNCSVTEFDFR